MMSKTVLIDVGYDQLQPRDWLCGHGSRQSLLNVLDNATKTLLRLSEWSTRSDALFDVTASWRPA